MQSQVQYTNPSTSPGYTLFAFIFSIIMDSESFHLDYEVDIFFRHKWVGKMEINMYIYMHIYSVLGNILFISYIIISFTNISVCK